MKTILFCIGTIIFVLSIISSIVSFGFITYDFVKKPKVGRGKMFWMWASVIIMWIGHFMMKLCL